MVSSPLSECFGKTYRLCNILHPGHSINSLIRCEYEFKGDRQKLLQAGTIFDLESYVSRAVAVWMSPSVLLMTGDVHDEVMRHGHDSIPPAELTNKLAMNLDIRTLSSSSSTTASLRFMLYWDRKALLNESIQYVVELLLAISQSVDVESLTMTGIDETFRVADTAFEPLDAMTLEDFLDHHENSLNKIDITSCLLSAASCRLLGNTACRNLFVKIFACSLEDLGALGDGLALGRGPKRIAFSMPTQDMAPFGSFPANDHIESLEFEYVKSADTMEPRDMQLFVGLIQRSQGLKEFTWNFTRISEAAWSFLLQSIVSHSSLKDLSFRGTNSLYDGEPKTRRTMAVAQCLRSNHCLESIFMLPRDRDEEVWMRMVSPLLNVNMFRKRLHAMSNTEGGNLTRALLSRVLQKVKHDPNLVRCCLEEDSDLLFG